MLLRLFLLFTLVPILELALLIEVGQRIGTGATVLLVIFTGFLGAFLTRTQGVAVLRRTQSQLNQGQVPAEGLVDGVLILIGGIFLITPGVLTDLAGISLALPASRTAIKRWLRTRLEKWVRNGSFRIYMR